jgi:hypothetical protein
MAVSAVGTNLTFRMVRRMAAVVVVVFFVLSYLYGPAATPALRSSATNECNAQAHDDFRDYRLVWQVGVRPHWTCWDASRPNRAAVDLGWWTDPFSS